MTAPANPAAPEDRVRRRLLRNIALAAGLAGFALSFAVFDAVLPGVLRWLAGERPGAPIPLYGGPALARVAIAALLAACVGASVFASLGRGVIFRSERLASPAPSDPVSAAITGAFLGLGLYVITAAALPAVAPFARWPARSDFLAFVMVPAAVLFFWRVLGLAAAGAAAQRRERDDRRVDRVFPPRDDDG